MDSYSQGKARNATTKVQAELGVGLKTAYPKKFIYSTPRYPSHDYLQSVTNAAKRNSDSMRPIIINNLLYRHLQSSSTNRTQTQKKKEKTHISPRNKDEQPNNNQRIIKHRLRAPPHPVPLPLSGVQRKIRHSPKYESEPPVEERGHEGEHVGEEGDDFGDDEGEYPGYGDYAGPG